MPDDKTTTPAPATTEVDKILNPQDYDYETTRTMTLLNEEEQATFAEGLDEDAADPTPEPEPEPEKQPDPAPEPAATKEADPSPAPSAPQIHEIPEDVLTGDKLEAKLDEISASRKELLKKYEDLEINADELETQITSLTEEAIKLSSAAEHHQALRERDLQAANAAQAEAQQAFEAKWNDQVAEYKAEFPDLFGQDLVQHFDAVVRRVTAATPLTLDTMRDALEEAHAALFRRQDKLGVAVPALDAAAPAPAPAKNPATTAEKPAAAQPAEPAKTKPAPNPLGTVPRTLAQVPAAQAMPADDSRFAALNGIVADANASMSEAAIKKLPQAEYEAWLAEG